MITWTLIPTKFKVVGAVVVTLALMAFSASSAYNYQENKYERKLSDQALAHERDLTKINDAGTKALLEQKRWYEQLSAVLHQQNEVMFNEYSVLKKANDQYLADIGSGKLRLFVPVKSCGSPNGVQSDSKGPSVVDGGGRRAQLDPAFAGKLTSLTGEGDSAIKKLLACRAHVKEIEKSQEKRLK